MKITEFVQDHAENSFFGEERKKSSKYLVCIEKKRSQSIGSTGEG